MNKFLTVTLVIISGVALSHCQSANNNFAPRGNVTPNTNNRAPVNPLTRINGKWVPEDPAAQKIYYNEFRNGKFVSRSPDGSQTIAAGQYSIDANGAIAMKWYSEARKTTAQAQCKELSSDRLQCTSGASVFNLRRS